MGDILNISITPIYFGSATNSVDAFQDECDSDPPFEPFTDHEATLAIEVINPTSEIGNITIEKYTIRYFRNNDSIGAPPIESDTRFKTIVINPASLNTVKATIIFVDIERKNQYQSDINNYTATYTFEGYTEFGATFTLQSQAVFEIGNFDNCP